MKDKTTRQAEARIKKAVNEWAYKRWVKVDPEMIKSLNEMMQEEHCYGIINGHNIATAKAANELKRNEKTISEVQDAMDGRR